MCDSTTDPVDKTPSAIKPATAIATIFIAMNESGDCQVGMTETEASTRLQHRCGGIMCRIVGITVAMMPPRLTGVDIDIADGAGEIVTFEAEVA